MSLVFSDEFAVWERGVVGIFSPFIGNVPLKTMICLSHYNPQLLAM
jgi:hypothetical protein